MSKVIAYTNDAMGVSIITPILDSGLTLEQIAQKDVPLLITYQQGEYDENDKGEYDENDKAEILRIESPRPYLILDASELPERADRDRWVIEGNSVISDR